MASKKQRAKSALKTISLLLLDASLRGELAPDLARFFGTSKQLRDSDEIFKAQLKVGHDQWKDQTTQPVS